MATIKNLAFGLMATATTAAIYTAATAAGSQVVIKSLICVNNDSSSRTVNVLFHPASGDPTKIIPKDLSLAAGNLLEFTPMITLGAGDGIIAYASVSGVVDYTLSGVEISA